MAIVICYVLNQMEAELANVIAVWCVFCGSCVYDNVVINKPALI